MAQAVRAFFLAALLTLPSAAQAQQPKRDTLANGIATGALVGGASAFAFVKIAEARCGPGCEGPDGPLALQAALGGAGLGGAVGLIVDLLRKPNPAAPSIRIAPVLARRTRAITMRLQW